MMLRWLLLAAALGALLWLDFTLALAGSLYRNDIKAVYVGIFLVAVVVAVFGRVAIALFVLHNAALAYFALRDAGERTAADWFGWIAWLVVVNALVAAVVILRGRLTLLGR